MIDGEIVALDANGRPSFNVLQNYGSGTYYVFDVSLLKGKDLISSRAPGDLRNSDHASAR